MGLFDQNRILACPSCAQKIRLPVVLNKTLRIRCQKCRTEFEVRLQSPLLNLFSWNKKQAFLTNFKEFTLRFHRLPLKPKLFLTTFVFFLVWFLGSAATLLVKSIVG